MGVMFTLGTGEVRYTRGRQIIHFGSPEGSTYQEEDDEPPRNISVKDWVAQNAR